MGDGDRKRALLARYGWTRLVLGVAVIAFGLMLMATGIQIIVHLALWWEPWLGTRLVMASIVPAAVMTWCGLVSFFGIAVPLVHWVSKEAVTGELERALGRESHAELAISIADGRARRGEHGGTPALGDVVIERALEDFRSVPWLKWPPVRRAQWVFPIFAITTALTLGVMTQQWTEVQRRLDSLVAKPLLPAGGRSPISQGSLPVESLGEGPRPALPCRSVEVSVVPPTYTGLRPFDMPWGLSTRVVDGSTLSIRCQLTEPGARPLLMAAGGAAGGAGVQVEAPTVEGEGGTSLRWRLGLERETVVSLAGVDGTVQPGRVHVVVVPDRPPTCTLLSPDGDIEVDSGDSLRVSTRAEDDFGLHSVFLRYMVEGIDSAPLRMELSSPRGEREVSVRRDVPVMALGAEAGDVVLLYVEVSDTNESAPSLCTTARHRIRLSPRVLGMEEMILRIGEGRDEALDILAEMLEALPAKEESSEALVALLDRVARYSGALLAVAQQMEHSGELKGEDIRRVSGLAVSLDIRLNELANERNSYQRRMALDGLVGEIQDHVWVLDGLCDKLLREHLFHMSGRLLADLNRTNTLGRESLGSDGGRESFSRSLRKMRRHAARLQELSDSVRAPTPVLFTSLLGVSEKKRMLHVAEMAHRLSRATGDEATLQARLNELSVVVESLAQSLEGAYAQSVNRLSASFRAVQGELTEALGRLKKGSAELRVGLGTLVEDFAAETETYYARSETLESAQRLAADVRELSKVARRLRSDVFVPVDRKQVGQLQDGLRRLAEELSLLRLGRAGDQLAELVSLAQAMEFSLQIAVDFGTDSVRVEENQKELGALGSIRDRLDTLAEGLEELSPERQTMKSLQPDRLLALAQQLDQLLSESALVRQRMADQQKMFPIFFDRLVPLAERVNDAYVQAKEKWTGLLFADALQVVAFAEEALMRLDELMRRVPEDGAPSGILQGGGSIPRLDVDGKGRVIQTDRLREFLELAPLVSERKEWLEAVEEYYKQLSR